MLDTTKLFEDIETTPDKLPSYRIERIDSHGSVMYTYVLLPDGGFEGKRPCVLMFHGFPGFVRNDDLAHALRRIGCVVVMPYHRGAWGSGGTYSFSHTIEDAVVAAEWVSTPETCEKYNIDTENIFTLGHSMGGHTTLNAVKQLPFIRGMILLAPYDVNFNFRNDSVSQLELLISLGDILKVDSPTSLIEDARSNHESFDFRTAFDAVEDKHMLFIGGSNDPLAPPADMIEPLWNMLDAHKTPANQKYLVYPTTHGLDSHRNTLMKDVAAWLAEIVNANA